MYDPDSKALRSLLAIALSLAIAGMLGMLLVVGKSFLLPILVAVISVYVLVEASDAIGRLPGGRFLPEWLRRVVVLALFLLAVFMIGGVMISTAGQISARLPSYQHNVAGVLARLLTVIGADHLDWQAVWHEATSTISLERFVRGALGSISTAAGLIFLVLLYAVFMMAERKGFAHKIAVALPSDKGAQAAEIISRINTSIGGYLAVKTLVNVVLGVISYAVMWAFGVDFALFWAVLIALLNYIPYVGSILGVLFPLTLSMAQFGSLQATVGITVLLTAAQVGVGSFLEPRIVGRKMNMSPFVVLVALALWSTLWGIPGAILAIPLTSIIAIILSSFGPTRLFAVLLAGDVAAYEGG